MARIRIGAADVMQVAMGIVGDCPDAAFLVARDGTIAAWNTPASELFGITPWEASAHLCAAVVQGASAKGAPLCRAGCPLLTGREAIPRSMAMRIRCGLLGPGRMVHMHHLPIRDPRGETIAMLHLADRDAADQASMVASAR